MRRLDIGVASYGSAKKLQRTIDSLERHCMTDWRCFLIDNPGPDPRTREVIASSAGNGRFIPVLLEENVGYAGAVCRLMELAETEYIAYCDNDIEILTRGWDEILCGYLDRFHEVGIAFPNAGPYQVARGAYTEVMWNTGFCWVLSRAAMKEVGPMDTEIGHQEEADYCMRMRMAGFRCIAVEKVKVRHDASATSDPKSIDRINRGVVNFVNKWNRYFNGKNFHYHSPNVTRWEDWPPNALYLEEYFKQFIPSLNAQPETVDINGRKYDLIRVPRLEGFYGGRII